MQQEKKYPIGYYAPGNYHCRCSTCERSFFGDKRACQCEPCAIATKGKFDALSPDEQKELMERNAEAIREVFKNWGKPNKASGALENKYTHDQIKDAIWQELKESDYAGENNDRAYEVIGIVMAGIDKIGGEVQTGKLSEKEQERINSNAQDAIRGIRDNKTKDAKYHGYIAGATFEALKRQLWINEPGFNVVEEVIYCARSKSKGFGYLYHSLFIDINGVRWIDGQVNTTLELEILNESGVAPSGEREVDAVAFAEWMDQQRNSGSETWKGMAIWGKENAFQLVYNEYQKQNKR